MTPLCELAAKYGTDKLRHGYTPFYHALFEPIRDHRLHVVELGVHKGASVKMWLDYFQNSAIFAVDCKRAVIDAISDWECEPILADCGNIDELSNLLPGSIDILIDDASHKPADQITAFKTLWPRITPGGYYIVEDLHAGWAWDANGEHGFIVWLKNAISNDIRKKSRFLGQHPDVHFFRNLVAVRKA